MPKAEGTDSGDQSIKVPSPSHDFEQARDSVSILLESSVNRGEVAFAASNASSTSRPRASEIPIPAAGSDCSPQTLGMTFLAGQVVGEQIDAKNQESAEVARDSVGFSMSKRASRTVVPEPETMPS